MAYITQEYEINGSTTLSTWEQLSTNSEGHDYVESWIWPGRTLSGFISEDRQFIEPGETKTFDGQTAQVSGIWTLNKTKHPIKIHAIGDSGQIDVRVTEYTTLRPLADDDHSYTASQQFTMNHGETSSVEIYSQEVTIGDSGQGYLSIEISGIAGTSIKTIDIGGDYVDSYPGKANGSKNLVSCSWWDDMGSLVQVNDSSGTLPIVGRVWENGISVNITENGTLTYIPNKNTLNPNHPNLNN